jgi:excisionase family DNA binding protein
MNTLDINGAAGKMCVHPKTVLDLIRDGILPAARIGRAYVLNERDVADYIEAQIVAQTQRRRMGDAKPKRRVA